MKGQKIAHRSAENPIDDYQPMTDFFLNESILSINRGRIPSLSHVFLVVNIRENGTEAPF